MILAKLQYAIVSTLNDCAGEGSFNAHEQGDQLPGSVWDPGNGTQSAASCAQGGFRSESARRLSNHKHAIKPCVHKKSACNKTNIDVRRKSHSLSGATRSCEEQEVSRVFQDSRGGREGRDQDRVDASPGDIPDWVEQRRTSPPTPHFTLRM